MTPSTWKNLPFQTSTPMTHAMTPLKKEKFSPTKSPKNLVEEEFDLDDERICPFCNVDFSINRHTDQKSFYNRHLVKCKKYHMFVGPDR